MFDTKKTMSSQESYQKSPFSKLYAEIQFLIQIYVLVNPHFDSNIRQTKELLKDLLYRNVLKIHSILLLNLRTNTVKVRTLDESNISFRNATFS